MSAVTLFNRNFVLLFQGQFVSQLGSFVYFVAIVFWIKHATDSATIVGLIAMLATIPGILLGPFGGTFADHFSRKKIIVIGDIINGLTISSIAALMFFSPESTELIITLLFIEAGIIADLLDRNIPLIYMASGLCLLLLMPPLIINKSFHNLMAFVGEEESAISATETPI